MIAGVGIIAVLMIIIGNTFGFPADTVKGLTFTGIGILLILASAGVWGLHWIVGLVSLIVTMVYLNIGITTLFGDSIINLILNTIRMN